LFFEGKNMLNLKKEAGFTLVELAIVMVVIGLLVTIVAAGKNIIAAGKVRAVLTEVEEIQSAFVRFQEKYSDLPGDMQDAWSYWGTNCAGSAGDCNGDGDEKISWSWTAGSNVYHEGSQAWHHLQLAEMIGGDKVSGHTGAAKLGQNMPGSKIANAGWTVSYDPATFIANILQLGGEGTSNVNNTPIITPKDSLSIDNKLDDGLPYKGRVRANQSGANTCIDGTTTPNLYKIQNSQKYCYLQFQLDTSL
jgi:prepilin-type N-terminal cleavage/methylation domain-containing protein